MAGLAILVIPFALASGVNRKLFRSPPFASWIFIALAMIALYQSMDKYALKSTSSGPPSVSLQRWALGIDAAPSPVDQTQIQLDSFKAGELPCDIQQFETQSLARSLEPLHTTGAMYALALCALLTWIGSTCFSQKQMFPIILLTITTVGVLVGCLGVQGALSYKETNYLGLKTGSSFASFNSKNAAGAYLNVCIAAALGLFTWTLSNLKRKSTDIRYKVEEDNVFLKLKSTIEDFFADLSTPQIAALIAVVFLVVSLLMSLCRGAVVGAGVGLVGAILIANRGQRGGGVVVTLLLILASVGAMIAFNVDDNALSRIESLAELDMEKETTNGRAYIWGIAWQAMWFYGMFGSGLGTFQYAYLPFQNPAGPGWFYRAESLYLQCGVDLGILGLALMLLGLLVCFSVVNKRLSSSGLKRGYSAKIAAAYLLISLSIHGFVEHNLSIPAVFIPACLLLGTAIAVLVDARKLSDRSRDRRRSKESEDTTFQLRGVVTGSLLLALVALVWFPSNSALKNLAAGEKLDRWAREQSALALEDREPERFNLLLTQWSLGLEELQKNPTALRLLADASVFEFRREQLEKAPPNLKWKDIWQNTDPVLLQIGLDRAGSVQEQETAIAIAGGRPAIDLLNQASTLYARAQLSAPMDWRLCWGRCLTALECSRPEMAKLLSPVDRLGRHVSSFMINAALLFREQLNHDQLDQIWKQAMQVKPSSSLAAARNLLAERKPEDIDINIFPNDSGLLISLAKNIFTKDQYRDLHDQLWRKARDLFTGKNLTPGEREVWLANAAFALDETEVEVEHLRAARRFLPADTAVGIRLANRYRQQGDSETALALVTEMLVANSENAELVRLQKQLRAAMITVPK